MTNLEQDPRFEAALEECSRRVQRGEALETCLAGYPAAYREGLSRLVPLGGQMAKLREDPSPEFQARLEQQLLAQVEETRRERRGSLFGRLGRLFVANPALRMAAILLVIVALLAGGGFGVDQAAADSLPDSPLYQVKAAREQVQLALARSPEAQMEVRANLLQQRGQELDKALRANRPKQQVVEAVAGRVEKLTQQMVDQALERAARGNRQPAVRALVVLRAIDARVQRLSPQAAPEIQSSLLQLHQSLQAQERKLLQALPRNRGGAASRAPAPAVPPRP